MFTTASSSRRVLLRLMRLAGLLVLLVLLWPLLAIPVLGFWPLPPRRRVPSRPVTDYDTAVARINALQAAERAKPDFNPVCHSILLTHGHKTKDAIVFYHGFTNCPEQYRALAQAFFDRGYNVYVPLTPGHGRRDARGSALVHLTVDSLAAYATETADLAQGLGERVTVSGLSGGGAVAAWLAQERSDIALAAPTSPFLGLSLLPNEFLNRGMVNLVRLMPNRTLHWGPVATAPHVYAGFPTRAMGTYVQLGLATLAAARTTPPAATVRLILNDADYTVSNRLAAELATRWRQAGVADIDTYTFGRDMALPHDLIAPGQVGEAVDEVYGTLIDLLTGAVAA